MGIINLLLKTARNMPNLSQNETRKEDCADDASDDVKATWSLRAEARISEPVRLFHCSVFPSPLRPVKSKFLSVIEKMCSNYLNA